MVRGTLEVSDCLGNLACDVHLRRGLRSRTQQRSSVVHRVHLADGNAIFVVRPRGRWYELPACIVEWQRHENEGLCFEDVSAVSEVPEVAAYLARAATAEQHRLLARFFHYLLYSMHATYQLYHQDVMLGEFTLCAGVGWEGVSRIADVCCFKKLFGMLQRTFSDPVHMMAWLLVGHMLLKAHAVEYLSQIVCARALEPTYAAICEVMDLVTRGVSGHAASRAAAGSRTWRQVDVFCVASTVTRGATFAGTRNLYLQLQEYEAFTALATELGRLRSQEMTFSELTRRIVRPGLKGYTRIGYWTVHLARVLDPNFGGASMLKSVTYTQTCARELLHMGEGAESLLHLGIHGASPLGGMQDLCGAVAALAKHFGFACTMAPPHLVCVACEAHRRGVFGEGIATRRQGL